MAIDFDKKLSAKLLKRMMLVRGFEEAANALNAEKLIHGTLHLCLGEEAAVVGSTMPLKKQDKILTTHRGHGECIGKGVDINKMMAELLGRSTGTNYGRGGSMHITDFEKGVIGSNGIVGADAPIACGIALGTVLKNAEDTVTVCFFGDGAINQGAVLESMNLASAWKLPVIFVLIENGYAVSTKLGKATGESDIGKRGPAFGIKTTEIDGNDIEKVYTEVSKARDYVLSEKKPYLIIEHTYRTSGHSRSDKNYYRTEEEINSWLLKNPVKLYSEKLIKNNVLTETEVSDIKSQADTLIKEAVEFAKAGPLPDVSDIFSEVYA